MVIATFFLAITSVYHAIDKKPDIVRDKLNYQFISHNSFFFPQNCENKKSVARYKSVTISFYLIP